MELFDTDLRPTMDLAHGHYRTDGLDTAKGAAVIAIGNAATNRQRALMALYRAGDDGLTDFELSDKVGVQQTSIGCRRKELRDVFGYVRRASDEHGEGLSRPSPTGSPSAVWCLTAAGYIAAETLA